MSGITIREMGRDDIPLWLDMYAALYPEGARPGLTEEIERILAAPNRHGFLAEADGQALGFAEYALREYANGCYSQPVPFLEGVWVDPLHRRKGVATALIRHMEGVARAEGFREFGSDVELGNLLSQDVHKRLGFEETERVVYFRKAL